VSRSNSKEVWSFVDNKRERFFALSDAIWETPELNFQEFRSSDAHVAALLQEGFKVSRGIAGLPTAIMAEAGSGGPVIAFLGEFDALPGLSQKAGVAQQIPCERGANGHGCGHNLLGAGAMQAATAVKDYLSRHGLEGRVRYYACPAEEGGAGKGFMARAGAFDGVDAAITWHPAPFAGVRNPISLATNEMSIHFVGRSSHAAAAPHLGRSALDAVELMNVGVNYMREHMPSRARIHYAITDPGGSAPNVVQGQATVRYVVRGGDVAELRDLVRRVLKIAEGAALMTETTVSHVVHAGEANLLGNIPLEELMHKNLTELGPPQFDDKDRALASEFQSTFSAKDIEAAYRSIDAKPRPGVALCDIIFPTRCGDSTLIASTDVGNVSWLAPTVQMKGAVYAIGTPGHSWQLVAQGKAPAAHKGMEHAAKTMAITAVDLLTDPTALQRAKAEHESQLAETPYIDPIPEDCKPDLPSH